MNKLFFRIATAAAFSLFAATAVQADVNIYHVHGTVTQLDAANHKVTLSQDSVTELGWPVRTMTYSVDGDNVLSGISVGQSVDATFTSDSPFQALIHFITPTAR
nr:copper-binding protein [uncultured Tolumonas sp.]